MVMLKQMRDMLEAKIVQDIPDVHVNGDPLCRVPHILSVSIADVAGDAVVRAMADRGIALSAGSACTSESTQISHVLAALGIPAELARGTIRFSMGRDNKEEELIYAADALTEVIKGMRSC
jgi:cysteine desulfurase